MCYVILHSVVGAVTRSLRNFVHAIQCCTKLLLASISQTTSEIS